MADDTNEDSWLYGTSNPDSTTNEEDATSTEAVAVGGNEAKASHAGTATKKTEEPPIEFEDPAEEMEEDEEAVAGATTMADTTDGEALAAVDAVKSSEGKKHSGSDGDVDDEDSDDDDINVVIGDIKAAPSTYNIKQRTLGGSGQDKSKSVSQGGKFSVEDFEAVGTINGVPVHEFSIDSLEDKPWRKPGADITDYFNYGFNEETWRAYCERQKRFRVVESGVGLSSLTQNQNQPIDRQYDNSAGGPLPPGMQGPPLPISSINDQMQMPPPGTMPPPMGIHGPNQRIGMVPRGPRPISTTGSKENAIQVMTAECREYSRPGQLPPNFGGPAPGDEPFFPEPDPFDYGYEPTQESQWGNDNPGWVPSGIKELTPGPAIPPIQPMVGPLVVPPQMGVPPPQMRIHQPMMGPMPLPNMGMGPPGMPLMSPGPNPPQMRVPIERIISGPSPSPVRVPIERERHERHDRRDDRERDRRDDRDRREDRERRDERDDRDRHYSESRDRDRRERERREPPRERVEREREKSEKVEKIEKIEESERTEDIDRERRRNRERRERSERSDRGERESERSRRDRSRSREKSRRHSKSREKEREQRNSKTNRSEKKKSRKDKDEVE